MPSFLASRPVPERRARPTRRLPGAVLATALLACGSAPAQQKPAEGLRFAHVFADHCVLQRDQPLKLFGFGARTDGGKVTVTLAATPNSAPFELRSASAEPNADGRWSVRLDPIPARAEPLRVTVTQGESRASIGDVLVGEVWVTGGQSNMAWGINSDTEWDMEKRCANYPLVRYTEFQGFVPRPQADFPRPMQWFSLTRDGGAERASAVSYAFAVRLHRYLGVPVGIVSNAVGGTLAEAWTSRETLAEIDPVADYLADFEQRMADWPNERQRRVARYEVQKKKAAADGKKPPRRPNLNSPDRDRNQPSGCYNASLLPLRGLTVRGAVFLQGENNSIGRWNAYRAVLPRMITDWRRVFESPKLPFGLISLQGFGPHGDDLAPAQMTVSPGTFYYAAIRDIQADTAAAIEGVDWITTFDTGDTANIHPARKRPVGQRVARWALARVYGESIVHRGPRFASVEFTATQQGRPGIAKVRFSMDPHARGGRPTSNPIPYLDWPLSREGKQMRGFVLAGEDRQFWPATARRGADPGVLLVQSPFVPEPVAVRYGWVGYPTGNLVGAKHIPLAPFRSDDWPLGPDAPFGGEARRAWNDDLRAQRQNANHRARVAELAIFAHRLDELGRGWVRHAKSDEERERLRKVIEETRRDLSELRATLQAPPVQNSPKRDSRGIDR